MPDTSKKQDTNKDNNQTEDKPITQSEFNKLYGEIKRLENQVIKKDNELSEFKNTVSNLTTQITQLSTSLSQNQVENLKADIIKAADVADTDKVNELLSKVLNNQQPQNVTTPTHTQQPQNIPQTNTMAQVALYNFQTTNRDWWNKDDKMTQFANAQYLIMVNDPKWVSEASNGNYSSFFSELQDRCDEYKGVVYKKNNTDFDIPSDGNTYMGNIQNNTDIDKTVKKIMSMPKYANMDKKTVENFVKSNIGNLNF